jgi:pyoverdine/dityrosine biosynthesis protein Dit1
MEIRSPLQLKCSFDRPCQILKELRVRPNNRLQAMRGLARFLEDRLARWPRTPDPCVFRRCCSLHG